MIPKDFIQKLMEVGDTEYDFEQANRAKFGNTLPEELLMLAVMEGGIDCLNGVYVSGSSRDRGQLSRRKDTLWLLSDDSDDLFSFAHICEHFGWSVRAVRKAILGGIGKTRAIQGRHRVSKAA